MQDIFLCLSKVSIRVASWSEREYSQSVSGKSPGLTLTCPPLFSVPPVGHHGHRPGALAAAAGAGRGRRVPGAVAGGGGHAGKGGKGGEVPLRSHVSQLSANFYLT